MRSGLPSPLMSTIATERLLLPMGNGEPEAALKTPAPLPRKTLALVLNAFDTAISSLPSLLMSASAIAKAPPPLPPSLKGDDGALVNVPAPDPKSTEIVLAELDTTMSALPSPLTSPTATAAGPLPTVTV